MNKISLSNIIKTTLQFLEKEEYKSYDFFDALSSPYLNKIKNQFIRRIIIQLNGRSFVNFRTLLGIKKKIHTKAISDLLSIYSKLFIKEKKNEYLYKAKDFYNLLIDRGIKHKDSIAWGLNFPYSSRFVSSTENTPNLFNTINSSISLLDYYESTNDESIYNKITEVLNFIFNDLGLVNINNGQKWLRYYPGQTIPTYNVNAMASYLFLKINNAFNKQIIDVEVIHSLVNFLINGQNQDGSWYYTASEDGKWIDGFHSGYIIESLSYLSKHNFLNKEILNKAVNFFINHLISKDGTPKYFNTNLYPIEAQNCAQTIQTVAKLVINNNYEFSELLKKIIKQTIKYLYNDKGFFYYKKTKLYTNKNIFFRWSVTPMILSLLYAKDVLGDEI